MSAPAPDHVAATRRIEPALRALAADSDLKVHVVAAKHRLEKSWIWDWLKAHNGGRREFSAALVDRVLAATPSDLTRGAKPPGWQGSPANKAPARPPTSAKPPGPGTARLFADTAVDALVKAGRKPSWAKRAVAAAVSYFEDTVIGGHATLVEAAIRLAKAGESKLAGPGPVMTAAPAPVPAAPADDGKSPWEAHPAGPRPTKLQAYRPHLESLAKGTGVLMNRAERETFSKFLYHWTRHTAPSAAQVRRFLAWCDTRPVKPAKVPRAPKPVPVAKQPPRASTRREGMSFASLVREILADGLEINITIQRREPVPF